MSNYSPWGEIQSKKTLFRGFTLVSTSSHGGVRISYGLAKKALTESARKRGVGYANYLFYEEDCAWAIPYWELRSRIEEETGGSIDPREIFRVLSRWNPDYLIEIGLEPRALEFHRWRLDSFARQMREAKDPGLIVSALGLDDKVVRVTTADGRHHFVEEDSYNPSPDRLNLLKYCKIITQRKDLIKENS